ncbi:MAG: MarC family protein [Syntrophales bacterium]|jgi:multiple antibiotic resistance protein|nr:MarC family protein [Syntrophales bacterium]MDY0044985.1 MarC family protein [Syntrophales bacterium]
METISPFLTFLISLLIIMDPLGNLPFFLMFTEKNTPSERRKTAAQSSFIACLILILFCLTGDLILQFFRIGLPTFQLAGGFIFFIYALQMLRLIPSVLKTSTEEEKEGIEKENVAMVPLATPLLAGPGAITIVLAWQQKMGDPLRIALLILAIVSSCVIVYLVFYFGQKISGFLGVGGTRVVTRLMGLLLAVIAVQFMVNGLQQILVH